MHGDSRRVNLSLLLLSFLILLLLLLELRLDCPATPALVSTRCHRHRQAGAILHRRNTHIQYVANAAAAAVADAGMKMRDEPGIPPLQFNGQRKTTRRGVPSDEIADPQPIPSQKSRIHAASGTVAVILYLCHCSCLETTETSTNRPT